MLRRKNVISRLSIIEILEQTSMSAERSKINI
jgi:hypothetical protein